MDRQNHVRDVYRFSRWPRNVSYNQPTIYLNSILYHIWSCLCCLLIFPLTPFLTNSITQKPIVALLLVPSRVPPEDAAASSSLTTVAPIPTIALPEFYSPKPDPRATLKRYTGRTLDRIVGVCWWLFTLLGAGSALVGVFNFIVGAGAYRWWNTNNHSSSPAVV